MLEQKDLWPTKIQELQEPLATWLTKSHLDQINSNECVLFVDKNNYILLHNITYLSQIYPLVKNIYPDFKSLHLVETSFLSYLKQSKIKLYSIEVN